MSLFGFSLPVLAGEFCVIVDSLFVVVGVRSLAESLKGALTRVAEPLIDTFCRRFQVPRAGAIVMLWALFLAPGS